LVNKSTNFDESTVQILSDLSKEENAGVVDVSPIALQTNPNLLTPTPAPAAINPTVLPEFKSLTAEGNVNYGGEVKISHELEIKVSSTDGRLRGDEIGKLLTAELKNNNKLVNEIKNQVNNASFGVTSSPSAIENPQFG